MNRTEHRDTTHGLPVRFYRRDYRWIFFSSADPRTKDDQNDYGLNMFDVYLITTTLEPELRTNGRGINWTRARKPATLHHHTVTIRANNTRILKQRIYSEVRIWINEYEVRLYKMFWDTERKYAVRRCILVYSILPECICCGVRHISICGRVYCWIVLLTPRGTEHRSYLCVSVY